MLTVEAGYEAAIAAALGSSSDAVVVRDAASAAAAVQLLQGRRRRPRLAAAGRRTRGRPRPGQDGGLPAGARWAAALVTPAGDTARASVPLAQLLAGTAVVEDLDAAARLIAARPELTAVTRAGDVFTALTVTGGSATAPSLLEVQAAVDDAAARLAAVSAELERNRFALVRR